MKADDLIELQVRLEYRVEGEILYPFAGSTEQARFIAYRHPGGFLRYYRHDLPAGLRQELKALMAEQVFSEPETVRLMLSAYSPCKSLGIYESCYFDHLPKPENYPDVSRLERAFVVHADEQPVCWAWSERSNERCAEVAVETRPAYRRRGYARQAVSALAAAEMQRGRVVLYSYQVDNNASRSLGQSLGVAYFANCAAFD
jgi:GNAT superfamily N-acetyltransferase